jgi:hypothetical protein
MDAKTMREQNTGILLQTALGGSLNLTQIGIFHNMEKLVTYFP